MDDNEVQGPLSQVAQPTPPPQGLSPAGQVVANAPQFQGNPSMSGWLQQLTGSIGQMVQERPTAAAQQQALAEYMDAVKNAAPLNDNPWAALGKGVLTAPTGRSADMWNSAAQSVGNLPEQLQQDAYKRAVTAAGLKYKDVQEAREKLGGVGPGVLTALVQAGLNPGVNVKGVGRVNKIDGSTLVAQGFTAEGIKEYDKQLAILEKQGFDPKIPEVQQTALQKAKEVISGIQTGAPAVTGGAMVPGKGIVGNLEQSAIAKQAISPEEKEIQDRIDALNKNAQEYAGNDLVIPTITKAMDQAAQELVDLRTKQGKPATTLQVPPGQPSKELNAVPPQFAPQPSPAPMPMAPGLGTPTFPLATAAGKTEATKDTEKQVVEYEKSLVQKNDDSNAMLRNVGHLREEALKANFGAGSNIKTQALKWADTLGIPLSTDERNAMDANQVMGKIGLQLATIGAKNITSRPTQMEFQKLLEEGVPSTGMTRDAFLRVVNLFHEAASKEQGQLTDFMNWKHNRPEGTSVGDFSNYWALKQNDPRFGNVSVKDITDTMKARGMSWNQVLEGLRGAK